MPPHAARRAPFHNRLSAFRVTVMTASAAPSAATPAPRLGDWLIATLPPLFWAGNFLVARVMHEAIPPIQMSFWRWVGAFVILAPFALRALPSNLSRLRAELPFLLVLGAVGVTSFNCLVYSALHFTTVVNASLINAMMPVFTFVLAALFLRETPTSRQVVGIAIALAGAATIVARGHLSAILALDLNRGDLLVVAAIGFWALYTVLIRWRRTALPPILFLAAIVAIGVLFHLPLLAWEIPRTGLFTPSVASLATIFYLAVFPSTLAYIFWNRSVARLGPSRTGMFLYLMPVFSTALGVGLLGEPFRHYHVVGIALIAVGLVLVTRGATATRSG